MARVELRWTETEPAHPAVDVLVRLVALTDQAWETGRLDEWLMTPAGDGQWVWSGELPDGLRTAYHLCPVRDAPLGGAVVDEDRWWSVVAGGLPDPDERDGLPPGCVFGAVDRPASVLSFPGAPPQPWAAPLPDVPPPQTHRHEGPDGTVVVVQAPLAPSPAPAALVVLFDGVTMQAIGTPTTINNLQAVGVIGPTVTAYVESIAGSAPRGPTRISSLTEAAGLEAFSDELVTRLAETVDLDPRPDRRVAAGHSLGGLAALHLASARPDVFGSAATGSAALWWPGSATQLAGREVVDAVLAAPAHPRLWMEVGTLEGPDLLATNRGLHERARKAGLDVTYREVIGGHDLATWRGGLGDALAHLLGTAPG